MCRAFPAARPSNAAPLPLRPHLRPQHPRPLHFIRQPHPPELTAGTLHPLPTFISTASQHLHFQHEIILHISGQRSSPYYPVSMTPFSLLVNKLASQNHERVVVIFDTLMASVVQFVYSLPNVESYCFESISDFTS